MPNKRFKPIDTNASPKGSEPWGGAELFDSTPTYRDEVKDFIEKWNSYMWLPKILGTDRQAGLIRNALRRPFFKNNWRESFPIMAKSNWLIFKMKPRLQIDWYLEPDNFDKIMEGKYLDEKPTDTPTTHQAATNDDGDEIIL